MAGRAGIPPDKISCSTARASRTISPPMPAASAARRASRSPTSRSRPLRSTRSAPSPATRSAIMCSSTPGTDPVLLAGRDRAVLARRSIVPALRSRIGAPGLDRRPRGESRCCSSWVSLPRRRRADEDFSPASSRSTPSTAGVAASVSMRFRPEHKLSAPTTAHRRPRCHSPSRMNCFSLTRRETRRPRDRATAFPLWSSAPGRAARQWNYCGSYSGSRPGCRHDRTPRARGTGHQRSTASARTITEPKATKKPARKAGFLLVAGAGFEPATFRL